MKHLNYLIFPEKFVFSEHPLVWVNRLFIVSNLNTTVADPEVEEG